MPHALRELFGTILVFCDPVNVHELWDEFHSYMVEDYMSSSSLQCSINHLLRDLDAFLGQHGKSISDYDLPPLIDDLDDFTHVPSLIVEERSVPIPAEDLSSVNMLNNDQRYAFNQVINSVNHTESSIFFIDGPGGTGKTFLYGAILAHVRSGGHLAIATASSGLAAIMMPGGRTAHSRFKIPIRLGLTSTCNIVVEHGTRAETSAACITNSIIWDHIQVIHLRQNMRAITDPSFAELLLRIGDGTEPHVLDDMVRLPDDMVIPWESEESLTSLIDNVFFDLQLHAHDKSYIVQRAIISPTNHFVDEINDKVIQLFPGEEITYYSYDSVENDIHGLYQPDFLNSISPGGLPLHKLTLKLGSPVILMRNISPKTGLCNGTRLLCIGFYENFIHVEIVNGSFSGSKTFLPRIPLKSSEDSRYPFVLMRKQFPIRLSFGLTINRSQGQTIPHVGVYLPEHVFSHGQLYVALSRGTSMSTTKVLVKKGHLDGYPVIYTRNVVYDNVLLSAASR